MNKFKTTKAVNRLSILLAILVPLVFIGIVMLKNQKVPAGFEIIKLGGIMLAIAIAVWIAVRITALLATILGDWLDSILSKALGNKKTDKDQVAPNSQNSHIIDAEIVDEETSDGVWKNGDMATKAEPDWAKATLDPHAALSSDQEIDQKIKQKRVLAPPSKTTKTIMVVIAFAVIFALIRNLFDDEWLTLLAPIPGLWAIISLWWIWDPKKETKSTKENTEQSTGKTTYNQSD
ncbi:hypothetical protein WH96_19235 [Kiloniella spongiae]|uniref:Uncharacterized protein n=1 Tax=Kiloniella spongiae TaxID=1489064 RepID=A0A0H2M9C0_9PROT|nr:hypothetical protein [Kiloniella spongiae]KLN59114.1 hypothetical protein WH96_19235 [Kiloniella spongiae]